MTDTEFKQFLADVMTAAGLVEHGKRSKALAGRLSARVMELYTLQGSSVPDEWRPIETAPKDGTHVLLANKSGTRVASGMYGDYGVWAWVWPYVMVEPAYWRPMPAVPGAQENNDAPHQ